MNEDYTCTNISSVGLTASEAISTNSIASSIAVSGNSCCVADIVEPKLIEALTTSYVNDKIVVDSDNGCYTSISDFFMEERNSHLGAFDFASDIFGRCRIYLTEYDFIKFISISNFHRAQKQKLVKV